MHNMLKNI